jgi:hypothetical protein
MNQTTIDVPDLKTAPPEDEFPVTVREAAKFLGVSQNQTMDEFSEYSSIQQNNREVFYKNFVSDTQSFKDALTALRDIWGRLGTERDKAGESHVGLLPFSNILVRQVIFGFEHLACYQSFLAWLTFRPGLEALLMLGEFVDDPANAKIWLNRGVDVNLKGQIKTGHTGSLQNRP